MKMHHLDEDEVKEIMGKIQNAVKEELPPDKIEEIFKLSKVNSANFLNCTRCKQIRSILKLIKLKAFVSSIPLTSILKEYIKTWMDGQFGQLTI